MSVHAPGSLACVVHWGSRILDQMHLGSSTRLYVISHLCCSASIVWNSTMLLLLQSWRTCFPPWSDRKKGTNKWNRLYPEMHKCLFNILILFSVLSMFFEKASSLPHYLKSGLSWSINSSTSCWLANSGGQSPHIFKLQKLKKLNVWMMLP